MQDYIITGGISGGIYEPDSIAAIKHAELYYEEIRHMTTDVKNIDIPKEDCIAYY